MRVLFDQGVPTPLRWHLVNHDVLTAYQLGWSKLTNGALLDAAEREGFDILVTTDSNLEHQQNRRIAIIVLASTNWLRIQRAVDLVIRAVDSATAPGFAKVSIP